MGHENYICYQTGTLACKTVMIVNATRVTFLILVETETITPGDRLQLRFRR